MLIIIIGQHFRYGTSKSTYKFNKGAYDVDYFLSMLEREMPSIKTWPKMEMPAINVTVKEFNRLKQPSMTLEWYDKKSDNKTERELLK